MAEKRFPLNFPPGLFHNGTKTQAAGRWYDGNGVRFYQKTIQPIGGWVARTTTGATIAGVPNAAIGLQRNDNTKYLCIGTTQGLYVVSSSNVVYNITPTVLVGQTTLDWDLETFGQDLIAVVTPAVNARGNNVYKWEGATGAPAVLSLEPNATWTVRDDRNFYDGVNNVRATVATPERFLFHLGGADPAGAISIDATHGAVLRAARSGFIYTLDPGPLLID